MSAQPEGSSPINRLHHPWRALFAPPARDGAAQDKAEAEMVATLYSQPFSLMIGLASGLIASLSAAWLAGNMWLWGAVALRCTFGMAVLASHILPQWKPGPGLFRSSHCFHRAKLAYGLTTGMAAALVMALPLPRALGLLVVGEALVYAISTTGRNAGRPMVSIGQMVLTLLPLSITCLLAQERAVQILGLVLGLTIPAMITISLTNFRNLRDSLAMAETSQRLADKMQLLARRDGVTGLLNRSGLTHELVDLQAVLPEGRKLALLWVDLDRFKEINDTLGHQTGDRCLAEVAARLRKRVPAGAAIGRFGGDEFIIAFETGQLEEAQSIAQMVMAAINRPIRVDDHRLDIGCSIGMAALPDHGGDMDTVMQAADLALNHAKTHGKGQVALFTPAMTSNLVRRKEIETDLRQALKNDELSVFFQPIVDLHTGRIRAFEALVRWFHPEKGELRPDEFIPVAEESGAIITLGNWITLQAAKAAAHWPDDVTLAVNLSPIQIRAPGAALAVLNALREARLPAHRLELEITETVVLDHSPATANFIEQLSEAGVRFALDDFGTGYSSLGYLDKYPFKKIKIDRSFVSGLQAGKTSSAIIRAVSAMGQALDMEIVAEGLETLEQVAAVREAGCTLGQGWYFSRAVPDYLARMLLDQEAAMHAPTSTRTHRGKAAPESLRKSA
ncbi:putative bifunctional diguanylate cyclase/phosphodiesterase [Novosphingobium umbonatum]|nr:EAL domain-containing protein [Novosphingobium umbonatum]